MNPVIECLKKRYVFLDAFDFDSFNRSLKMEDLSDVFNEFINATHNAPLSPLLQEHLLVDRQEFNESLPAAGKVFHSQLLRDHLLLNVEYSVLCEQLTTHLSNPFLSHEDPAYTDEIEEIKNQLVGAFILSKLIENLNTHYLPRNLTKIHNQQEVFKSLLSNTDNPVADLELKSPIPTIGRRVRELTSTATWYRLFLVRSKRLIELIALLGTGWQHFQDFASFLTEYATPVIAYVAWCFFIPRLLVNLISIGAHTIPIFLSEKEKKVDFWDRLRAQLIQRWPEILNDLPWLFVGVMNCMVLIGVLASFAATLTLVFYGHDVMMACSRAIVELSQLCLSKREYLNLKNSNDQDPFNDAVDDYVSYVDRRVQFDLWRLGINVIATLAIFLGGAGALAIFSFCPVIPLTGAITLVTVSLSLFITERILKRKRPKDNPEELRLLSHFKQLPSRLGFFSKTNEEIKPLNVECLTPHSGLTTPNSESKPWAFDFSTVPSLG